jgi:hypothetical protein
MPTTRVCVVATLLLSSSCATTTTTTTVRSLPTTLSTDASRLLEGCGLVESAYDVEVHCPDGLIVISHRQPRHQEAPFLADAAERGNLQGARTEWSNTSLTIDEGVVPVREARFFAIDGDTDTGSLFGAGRLLAEEREDFWCVGAPEQRDRCLAILTAMLQRATPTSTPTATPLLTPTSTPTATTGRPGSPTTTPAMMGRTLSLPAGCVVEKQQPDRGRYRCGTINLTWHTVADMDDGAAEAEALLSSLPADGEPTTVPCRIGNEPSVCQGTNVVVVGTAWVDGTAVVAACVGNGVDDIRGVVPCRTMMNGAW